MAKRGPKPNPNKIVRTNVIPSLAPDRIRLKKMVSEAVDARTRISGAKDQFNSVRETIMEEFPITSKLMNKLIDFEYKQNADAVTAEWEEIAEAHEQLEKAV